MVTWRNVLPGGLWLAVTAQAARAQTYDITEEPRPDECFRYLITTTVDGKILAAAGDQVQELPLRLTNRIELLRRNLEVADGRVAKSAAVYLDGGYLGTGLELASLHGSLAVAQGEHVVEIARPGYKSETRTVIVGGETPALLELTLERSAP